MAILWSFMSEEKPKRPFSTAPLEGQLIAYEPESEDASEEAGEESSEEVELLSGLDEGELEEVSSSGSGDLDLNDATELPEDGESLVAPHEALEVTSRSLQRLDPLTIYINDIKRYPLLSREEEHEL